MIAAPMCFSILQTPRCRIYSITNFWTGRFGTSSKLIYSKINSHEETERTKKWTRRSVSTNPEGSTKAAWSSEAKSIKREILQGAITDITQFQKTQVSKEKEKETAKLTILVFDIETTGFKSDTERIIEFACRDLSGGIDSTFQTLVNPGCDVNNSDCHGITTTMVNSPDNPRMADFIPIFLKYVKSRQKPGCPVVFVAHNGRKFDVPFLIHEFKRCSVELPSDWLFLDTLPMAREMKKLNGIEGKASLQSLSQEFKIRPIGAAHRAMSDVHCLSHVFQRLTVFLKLTSSDLIEKSFKASDVMK